MKKILLIFSLLSIVACKDETTDETPQAPGIEQKVYFSGNKVQEVFVQEYQENRLSDVKAKLIYPAEKNLFADLIAGDASQLADYNTRNGSDYKLLPTDNYTVDEIIVFGKGERETSISITLKSIVFDSDEVYALPLRILNRKSIQAIDGEESLLLVIRPNQYSKALKMGTVSATSVEILPANNVFEQWSFETAVYIDNFSNEMPIVGLNNGYANELLLSYVNQQLQMKINNQQFAVAKQIFTPEIQKWYALSFTYDGNTLRTFVNGKQVAANELQEGATSLRNLYIAGGSQSMREVRFWKKALTQQEILANNFHFLPVNSDLQLYLPLNGKKRDASTNVITDDETQLWDWSSNAVTPLALPLGATFENYIFPSIN